jgi:hypothetical protein
MEQLRYIRSTMEASTSFTAVPGWGGIAMGFSALAAAALASLPRFQHLGLGIWLADAVVAVFLGSWAMARKARQAGTKVYRGSGRRFLFSLCPPILAGALLTPVLLRAGIAGAIPGTWLLLYGTGVVTAGSHSIRLIPIMGLGFMVLGGVAFLTPASWGNAMLALGFGGLHILFGILIVRRHGG